MAKWVSYNGTKLVEPTEVKGYSQLIEEHQKLFENFLINYYQVWEFPEEHQPTAVRFIKKDNYLRVTFKETWLHIKDQTTWY